MVLASLALLLAGFILIWRGVDVRIVLFAIALLIGAIAGQPGEVFRKTAEALANPTYMLPICWRWRLRTSCATRAVSTRSFAC